MVEKKEGKVFSRNDFVKLPKPTIKKVWVDNLDGYVYFKQISGTDQDSYEGEILKWETKEDGSVEAKREMKGMRAKYLVRTLCDEKGNRLFKDEEYTILGEKLASIIGELHVEALKANGADTESVEETKKNSEKE